MHLYVLVRQTCCLLQALPYACQLGPLPSVQAPEDLWMVPERGGYSKKDSVRGKL